METRKKHAAALAAARRIIQVIAFVLFPGLFLLTFSAIGEIISALAHGTFSAAALAQPLVLAVSVLLITAVMGRFFCGFLCSFGAMGDLAWFLGRKLKLPQAKLSEPSDRALKLVKYLVLAVIAVGAWILGLFSATGAWSPWTVFGMYATIGSWPALSGLLSIGGVLLLAIFAASMFIDRFFCRFLCPLGAIFVPISRFRLYQIRKPGAQCGACRACTNHCCMSIPLYRQDTVSSGECIDCFACTKICPRGNVSADPKPAVAAVIATCALSGMYYAGNLVGSAVSQQPASSVLTAAADGTQGQYTDGTYTGSGTGLRGTTTVEVTVSGGYITQIDVTAYEDDEQFFDKAKSTIISEVLSAQSTDVSTVAGATFSSNGLLEAISSALNVNFENPNATQQQEGHGRGKSENGFSFDRDDDDDDDGFSF